MHRELSMFINVFNSHKIDSVMKNTNSFVILFSLSFLLGCGNNSQVKSTTETPTTTKEETTPKTESNNAPSGDGIVGEWNLALETYDENSNKKLDDEERKKGFSNKYYYRFNADGSCLIHTMKFKGHY